MKIRNHLLLTGIWTLCSLVSMAQLKIVENGNVGIGTTTPSTLFHINKTASGLGAVQILNTLSYNTTNAWRDNGGGVGLAFNQGYNSGSVIDNQALIFTKYYNTSIDAGSNLYFQTANSSGTLTTALTLDKTQNATFSGMQFLNIPSTYGQIYFYGNQGSGKHYKILNAIEGVSNTGFSIRNVSDGTTPFYIDGSDNAKFSGTLTANSIVTGINTGVDSRGIYANGYNLRIYEGTLNNYLQFTYGAGLYSNCDAQFNGNGITIGSANAGVQISSGGYIDRLYSGANDNLVIRAKGAGAVMLNYGNETLGTYFYDGGTTLKAYIDGGGAATFYGAITSKGNLLRAGDASNNGGAAVRLLGATSGSYNWQLANNWNNTNFEITPSTEIGGTTFSNPMVTLTVGSPNTMTLSGSLQASSFKIPGGDSLHFLLANGTTSLGAMIYPGGDGIAIKSGSGWGTSITNNSTNWNSAYNAIYSASLTSGYLPKWNGSYLVNSLISDNGSGAIISGDLTCNGVDASTIYASSSIQSEYTIESHYGDIHTSGGEVSGPVGRFGQVIEESDQNIKTNITNLTPSGDKLFSLRPVTYNLTSQATTDTRLHMGFIAQEVKEIFPDMVYEGKNGLLGISYTQLIPVLVQTVKDQNDKIKSLEDRIARLESLIK